MKGPRATTTVIVYVCMLKDIMDKVGRDRHMAWASTIWVALEGLGLKQLKVKKQNATL